MLFVAVPLSPEGVAEDLASAKIVKRVKGRGPDHIELDRGRNRRRRYRRRPSFDFIHVVHHAFGSRSGS